MTQAENVWQGRGVISSHALWEGRCTGSKRGKGCDRKRNDTVDYIKGGEGREETGDVKAQTQIHRQAALHVCPPRGGILGRKPDKILRSFPPCFHSHLYNIQHCLEILFLQTDATSYSFLRSRRKI
jgi:hypothetical protein